MYAAVVEREAFLRGGTRGTRYSGGAARAHALRSGRLQRRC